MVDFFPKPNNKIITVKEAIKNINTKNDLDYNNKINWNQKYLLDLYKLKPGENLSKINKSGYSYMIIDLNKPLPTLCKSLTYSGATGYFIKESNGKIRDMTINEFKRCCSYPDNFKFPDLGTLRKTFENAVNRLGNSVMPKFMKAIAEHIKLNILKKENSTVISTFCGTGGSSLGYKWAGYKELLAIDFDKHAVECFKLNFSEVPVWYKSVLDIRAQEILDFCKIKKGELDVLDGSPPCQGFSTAGKRQVNDPRNDLFKRYVYFIDNLEPKVFIMENVTGMAKGKMKGRFIEIMKTLKGLNYKVKCKQMNSKYYGVPQSRERLIFIGVRKDIYSKIEQS